MPLYSVDRFDDHSFLAIWKITESEEELLNNLAIPDDELDSILQTPSKHRRIERLAVRALINASFDKRQYLGYEENNRPFLKNYPGDISISHAGDFACIYVDDNKHTGVDIEPLSRSFEAVEKRVLSPYEHSYLDEDDKQQQLCLIWCAKEAIYKVMSVRGVDFSKDIEIKKFSPKEKGKLQGVFTNKQEDIDVCLQLYYKFIENHAFVWVSR